MESLQITGPPARRQLYSPDFARLDREERARRQHDLEVRAARDDSLVCRRCDATRAEHYQPCPACGFSLYTIPARNGADVTTRERDRDVDSLLMRAQSTEVHSYMRVADEVLPVRHLVAAGSRILSIR